MTSCASFRTSSKRNPGGGRRRTRKVGHDNTAGKQLMENPRNVRRQPETWAGDVKENNAKSTEDRSEDNDHRASKGQTDTHSSQKEEDEEEEDVVK